MWSKRSSRASRRHPRRYSGSSASSWDSRNEWSEEDSYSSSRSSDRDDRSSRRRRMRSQTSSRKPPQAAWWVDNEEENRETRKGTRTRRATQQPSKTIDVLSSASGRSAPQKERETPLTETESEQKCADGCKNTHGVQRFGANAKDPNAWVLQNTLRAVSGAETFRLWQERDVHHSIVKSDCMSGDMFFRRTLVVRSVENQANGNDVTVHWTCVFTANDKPWEERWGWVPAVDPKDVENLDESWAAVCVTG